MAYGDTRDTFQDLMGSQESLVRAVLALQQNVEQAIFTPRDYGLLTWNYDPALVAGGTALPTAGTINVIRLRLRAPALVTNIVGFVNVAGATLTASQCFAALCDASGNVKSATADQSVAWVGTGKMTMALTTPQQMPAGDVLVALLFNGTTGPSFMRSISSSIANVGLAAAASRFATADTSKTTMPAALASLVAANTAFWMGLS